MRARRDPEHSDEKCSVQALLEGRRVVVAARGHRGGLQRLAKHSAVAKSSTEPGAHPLVEVLVLGGHGRSAVDTRRVQLARTRRRASRLGERQQHGERQRDSSRHCGSLSRRRQRVPPGGRVRDLDVRRGAHATHALLRRWDYDGEAPTRYGQAPPGMQAIAPLPAMVPGAGQQVESMHCAHGHVVHAVAMR